LRGYAKRAGFSLAGEFTDPGVSGADPIESRRGFAQLLDRIEENGVRTVIVEDGSRANREAFAAEEVRRHPRLGSLKGPHAATANSVILVPLVYRSSTHTNESQHYGHSPHRK
jgi:hypothetical protein